MGRDISKVGPHLTLNQSLIEELDNIGTKCCQVFLGSPRRAGINLSNLSLLNTILDSREDLDIVVHAPYWTSPCKSDESWMRTLEHTVEVANSVKHPIKYVMHLGGRGELTKVEAAQNLVKFCKSYLLNTPDSKMILCLENDAGSKSDTKMGYVNLITNVVKTLNSPRIRMCFDTEHAYAAGIDVSDTNFLNSIKDYVSVVHLNSIPSSVVFGGHLDRHSSTLIRYTVEGPMYLKPVYDVLYDTEVPFILERDYELALIDRKDVESLWT